MPLFDFSWHLVYLKRNILVPVFFSVWFTTHIPLKSISGTALLETWKLRLKGTKIFFLKALKTEDPEKNQGFNSTCHF